MPTRENIRLMARSPLETGGSDDTIFFSNLAKCNVSKPKMDISNLNQDLYIFYLI